MPCPQLERPSLQGCEACLKSAKNMFMYAKGRPKSSSLLLLTMIITKHHFCFVTCNYLIWPPRSWLWSYISCRLFPRPFLSNVSGSEFKGVTCETTVITVPPKSTKTKTHPTIPSAIKSKSNRTFHHDSTLDRESEKERGLGGKEGRNREGHEKLQEKYYILVYLLKIIKWKRPGRMKARKVQQLEPTKAMRVEKSGMARTTSPVKITKPALRIHCRSDRGKQR